MKLKFLKWLMDQRWYHWVISVISAVLGFFAHVFDVVTGRDRRVAWFHSWQNYRHDSWPLPESQFDITVKPCLGDPCGQYLVAIVVAYAPADWVRKYLPPEIELQQSMINQEGNHAVAYVFGLTENLRPGWCPWPGVNYQEFAVNIPRVQLAGQESGYTGPFAYLPRLYLNRIYPTVLGWLVGYQKRLSRMTTTETSYSIRSLFSGRPILDATFTPVGGVQDPPHDVELDKWKSLLAQPQVTQFAGNLMYMHYHIAWRFSRLQPVRAEINVYSPDLPGVPPGHYTCEPLDDITTLNLKGYAFLVSFPFELLMPFPRKDLLMAPLEPANPPQVAPPTQPATVTPPAQPVAPQS